MNCYGHDMDHDGTITTKDSGIFHEMMDSERQSDPYYGKSTWDICGEGAMLAFLVFATPLVILEIGGWLFKIFG